MAEKVTNEENQELVYEFEVKSNQHESELSEESEEETVGLVNSLKRRRFTIKKKYK